MRRTTIMILLGTVLTLALVASALAQGQGPGPGKGWGPGSRYQRMYNPATVETLTGQVIAVDTFAPGKGMGRGVHLMVKTEKETIPVHLGPSWYVQEQGVTFVAGDQITVTGSRIDFKGKPAVIAAEVKKGDQVLKLRDANGIPVWAGWQGK